MNIDNGVVQRDVKIEELKTWRLRGEQEMPFYLHTGENALVFSGNPETVRDLLRIYNKYNYNMSIGLVSFLNEEGIAARKVSVPMDRILGYHVELVLN